MGGVDIADLAGIKGVGMAGVGMIADVARRGGVLSDRVRGSLDKFKGKITGGVKGAEADLHDYKTKLYKEAGIWENPIDGSLRYELHPEGYTAAVKKLDFEPKPVDEILLGKDYDQLRKLYPELEDVTVKFSPLGTPSHKRGMYNTEDKTISVNSALSHEQIRSTIHHELQHALQQADKVIDGASMPKDAAKLPRTDYLTARLKYLTNQGEVEARAVQEALKGNTNVHPLIRDNIEGVVTGNGKKTKVNLTHERLK